MTIEISNLREYINGRLNELDERAKARIPFDPDNDVPGGYQGRIQDMDDNRIRLWTEEVKDTAVLNTLLDIARNLGVDLKA